MFKARDAETPDGDIVTGLSLLGGSNATVQD